MELIQLMKLSVIVPTYNEAENIRELIYAIGDVCKRNKLSYNIVIVDDNSPDFTSKIVKEVMQENKNIRLIEREGKLGLGTAYIKGIKYSLDNLNPDLIMTMDADFSHNPKYIPDFVKKIKEGYDVVLGSRYIHGGGIGNWGIHRTIISKGANYLAKILLGLTTKDNTTGYRAYKREVLERIGLDSIKSNGYSFLIEMAFWCQYHNFKIAEIPIFFDIRRHGASKISKKEIFRALKTLFRLKFRIKLVNHYVARKRIKLATKFLNKNEKILDVGCGDMYITNKLIKDGYDVTGIDLASPYHLKMDATNMDFKDNSFDAVISFETIEHCDCINEIKRVLKPGGTFVLSTPAPNTDWIRKILVSFKLLEARDFEHHDYIIDDIRSLPFKPILIKKMFLRTSQFGVFEKG